MIKNNVKKNETQVERKTVPVDAKVLEAYRREMTERTIPEIVEAIDNRQRLATDSRLRHLKS